MATNNAKNWFYKASTSTIHNGADYMMKYNFSSYNSHRGL